MYTLDVLTNAQQSPGGAGNMQEVAYSIKVKSHSENQSPKQTITP